jgi:hypothetical protein
MRTLIAHAIESLILLLDEIDGDADVEDGHDLEEEAAEPSLGASEWHPIPREFGGPSGDQRHWAEGGQDDREDDGDDLEPRFVPVFEAG